jgi:two-component sensor histidine kinase
MLIANTFKSKLMDTFRNLYSHFRRMLALILILPLVLQTAICSAEVIPRQEADSIAVLLSKTTVPTERVKLLLRLAEFHIFKPEERKIDLDSAETFLKRAMKELYAVKSTALSGYSHLVASFLSNERGINDTALSQVRAAIVELKQSGDPLHLGLAYAQLAKYYESPDSIAVRAKLIEKSNGLMIGSGNIRPAGDNLDWLARVYWETRNSDSAIAVLKRAEMLYQAAHYEKLQSVYSQLGTIYFERAEYRKSMLYELLAVKSAERWGDTTRLACQIYNTLGSIYLKLEDNENALPWYRKALVIAEKHELSADVVTVALNIVNALNRLNRPVEALETLKKLPEKFLSPGPSLDFVIPMLYMVTYMRLHRAQEAKKYSAQLAKFAENCRDNGVLNICCLTLAKYNFDLRNFKITRDYLLKNDKLIVTLGNPVQAAQNFLMWYRLDSAEGNFRSAVRNISRYNVLHDSLYSEAKSRQLKQLEVEYETDKKGDSIKMAAQDIQHLSQQSVLQRQLIRQARTGRNAMVAGAILLLLLLGVIYNRYRLKQRNNKLLQAQQEEIGRKNQFLQHLVSEKEWLLKEVHHRVKNNLHTVICLLESQAAYLENDALKAVENTQHRIYAMSLIHQKLYQSEDIKTIDMSVYLPEFVRYLDESFDKIGQIRFELDIDPLKLGGSHAIPLSLIINEAVTNAIKYAFPGKRMGRIRIGLKKDGEDIILTIADNGIGIDSKLASGGADSLGLKLIRGLSEDINGVCSFSNDHGTTISVIFKADPLSDSNSLLNSETASKIVA